jgi:fucose permease
MQLLHFSFGLGTLLAPLVARQFIGDDETDVDMTCAAYDNHTDIFNGTSATFPLTSSTSSSWSNVTTTTTMVPEVVMFHSNVKYAFWVSSSLMLPIAAVFVMLSRSSPKGGDAARSEESEENAYRRHVCWRCHIQLNNCLLTCMQGWYHRQVIGLAFLFLMVYVGLEVGFGGYIYSYAVKVTLCNVIVSTTASSLIPPPAVLPIAISIGSRRIIDCRLLGLFLHWPRTGHSVVDEIVAFLHGRG